MTQRVYLHGAGLAGASWGEVAGMTPDLPGHNGRARAAATAADFARALAPDIPEDAVLIGHSLGGMVAMALAAEFPVKVRGLVLVSVPIRAPLKLISWYTPFVAPIVARVPGTKAIANAVGRRVETEAGRAVFRAHVGAADPSGLADALTVAGRFNGFDVLPHVRCPVLAVTGTRSLMTTGRYDENLTRLAPGARVLRLDAGHMIPFDRPDALEDAVAEFEAELAPTRQD
ncbi:MAG: alpha/beta hydrolase [Pseudomonadota bacterium]